MCKMYKNFAQSLFMMPIDSLRKVWYNIDRKEVRSMDKVEYIIKKLVKLVQQLNKLAIEIISLVGWILILIKLLS